MTAAVAALCCAVAHAFSHIPIMRHSIHGKMHTVVECLRAGEGCVCAAEIEAALAAPAAPLPPPMPQLATLDLDAGIDDDFVLNAEAISASEEESSEEEEEEEEGDDDDGGRSGGSRPVTDSEVRSASGTEGDEDGMAAGSDDDAMLEG